MSYSLAPDIRDDLGWTDFNPEEVSYKEMVELHELLTKTMGLPSLVVDADDLLENPGTFFSKRRKFHRESPHSPLSLPVIALLTVQSFARILIHNAILFI